MTAVDQTHPRHELDDLLLHPVRFSVVAALARAGTLGFREVRDAVEVSDSVLSKQMSSLEDAGYVTVGKGFVGKTPRTSLTLTARGRAVWAAHLDALRRIAGSSPIA
ncbi:transcriptional regulator [Curtobacterium sp. PhB142]|uniref:winged helix-turn-helix domain-containing protein n=1 Tax=unclassified Curtobacterium TaxID=257496 RepID=UPI00105300D0|nr:MULTISPECIES: transcriptional regulator [unclassified Curtobacterium]TCL87100.1 transcriptional regulator [Curtobacterium sp. PhB142]TCM02997.1 transcriptional regulator [Curtobacterium sp. PhB134]